MEQWKRIEYQGIKYDHEVSTKGRVRNMETGRILRGTVSAKGYLRVDLTKNGKHKKFYIHRLVAEYFIPNDNPTEKNTVNHIDKNKLNNNVENLEWLSNKDNIKYSKDKRVYCVELDKIFESITQASAETGLWIDGICRACKGERKTCGGFHWEYVEEK